MRTLEDLQEEAEQYFKQMENDKSATQAAYKQILSSITIALTTQDYASLTALIPYIEEGEGHLAFQYIGKTQRFLKILNIVALEQKYQKPLFCAGCNSWESLWEKYMLTLFAFRRLLFQLSEESFNEAVQYLRSCPISHFAAYIMTQDELLLPDDNLYENIIAIYSEIWSTTDIQQFFTLINSCHTNA